MFKQVASAAILILFYNVTIIGQPITSLASNTNVKGKPEELLAGTEAANAIGRLGDLSPAAIRERLKQMREPAYLPGASARQEDRRLTTLADCGEQAR